MINSYIAVALTIVIFVLGHGLNDQAITYAMAILTGFVAMYLILKYFALTIIRYCGLKGLNPAEQDEVIG